MAGLSLGFGLGIGRGQVIGGGGGLAPHRYWRVRATDTESGSVYWTVAELELRESVGGADVTGAGTASASSVGFGLPAANAFDNDTGTTWHSDSTFPHWLKYDFGAGNNKAIVEFAITSRNSTGTAAEKFYLEYSDDDVGWTTIRTVDSVDQWAASEQRVFGVDDMLWRILITAVDGGSGSGLAELEFRATAGGANQATGGVSFASDYFSTAFDSALAFDGSNSTAWSGQLPGSGVPFIGYGWPGSGAINQVAIRARDSSQDQSPTAFTVQSSSDGGTTWDDEWSVSGSTGWSASELRTFDRP